MLACIVIYNIFLQVISPVFTNELAMNQMTNSIDSTMGIQLYTIVSSYGWVLLVVIFILLFYKHMKNLFVKLKEKHNEEN